MWNIKLKFGNETDKIKAARVIKWFLHASDERAKEIIDKEEVPCITSENAITIADMLSILDSVDISIHYER